MITPKRFLRGLYRLATGQTAGQMWGRVFDLKKRELVSLVGFKMYVMPNDYIGRMILEAKAYEPHVTAVVKSILRPGDVFLDIGANIGYFTMLGASLVGESGRVLAVEPNWQNLQLVYASTLENQFNNIKVFPYAASDTEGLLRFVTVGSNGGVVTKDSAQQTFYFYVPAVRLDECLDREPRVDLIKIDVEAHEAEAIAGLSNLIMRWRPRIITEFHPWAISLNSKQAPSDYLEQLCRLGYGIQIILPDGGVTAQCHPSDVVAYWRGLGKETAHLDLLASPL